MKRALLIIGIVVLAAALVRVAELIVERGLDSQLPPLLTEVLGQDVKLAPIRADILSLTAHTKSFRMGGSEQPTLLARDVRVSLNWSDLLRGEIRLVTGAGASLLLDLSLWPESDEPRPDNYLDLEQWLPRELELRSGQIILGSDNSISIADARWHRSPDGGADLAWRMPRPSGILDVDVALSSLEDLLLLRRLDTRIALAAAGSDLPPGELEFTVTPLDAGGYRMDLTGSLSGMQLTSVAEAGEAWRWPHRSDTQFETLNVSDLRKFTSLLFADGEEENLDKLLSAPLPALSLPLHRARLRAGELRMGSGMLHDVDVRLSMQRNYLALTRINAEGMHGSLRGSAAAASMEDGWEVALGADLFARGLDQGLMARYIESRWYASDGSIRLSSQGASPGELLNDLRGTVEVAGAHRGDAETPVSLKATLDGSPEKFALEQLDLRAGSSLVTGTFAFTGGDTREIRLTLDSDALDITFLADPEQEDVSPGVALPTYLGAIPGYRVLADLDIRQLILPALTLKEVTLDADRGVAEGRVKLAAVGESEGALSLELGYRRGEDNSFDTTLDIDLDKVDLTTSFGLERGVFDSRTSGSFEFSGSGDSIPEIFKALRGKAALKHHLRREGDWSRDSKDEEIIDIGGTAALVIENNAVVGFRVDELDIDSLQQDLNGTVSLVSTRNPVLEANLVSQHLDIPRIRDILPESTSEAEERGVLQTLLNLAPARVNLKVQQLDWLRLPIENLRLSMLAGKGLFRVESLELDYAGARVNGHTELTGQGETVVLDAAGRIEGLEIDRVLATPPEQLTSQLEAPLSGDFRFRGSGQTVGSLAAGLVGHVKLDSGGDDPAQLVDVDLERLPDGGRTTVNRLRLAGSDLRGRVRRTEGSPERFEIFLDGGTLDTRPWEPAQDRAPAPRDRDDKGALEQTAEAARGLMGFVVRLVSPTGTVPPGTRVFDDQPLNVEPLSAFDIRIKGKLDNVLSSFLEIRGLNLEGTVGGDKISVAGDAEYLNGGPVKARLHFDGTNSPYSLEIRGLGTDVHRKPEQAGFPVSLEFKLAGSGSSEAELAAGLNGDVFMLLGEGPIDYGAISLVSRDVAAGMFRTLIPGAEKKPPRMQCGIGLIEFRDGVGITPYGYAARTDTANLLGGIELDLRKEKIRVKFQSRSREGVGISIGNAFSNSVEVAGPLSDPQVVPNTPGLLFRGWAAFATAGLSIIGESFLNRALASKNPCKSVAEEMRKTVCQSDHYMAGSALACPEVSPQSSPPDEAPAG